MASTDTIAPRPVALWLACVLFLLAAMVLVGGLTRLTDSGLSITEWKPVTGALPPLSEAEWQSEFAKYQTIPEYHLVNRGMSLEAFKAIYWWEWGHRLLGRLIGVVFLVPLLVFLWRGMIAKALTARLWVIFALGGLQGALGWWMVSSGLVERIDVSQYRLAAHLGLAFVIAALVLWTLLDVTRGGVRWEAGRAMRGPLLFSGLVFFQILLGAFVAGTDAGLTYNTWPLMDGRIVPEGLFIQAPWVVNFFENVTMIQFQHRMGAYAVAIAAAVLIWRLWPRLSTREMRVALIHVGAVTVLQILIGIWTLLAVAPLSLSALHQAGAIALLGVSIWAAHAAGRGGVVAARPPSPYAASA